MRISQPTLGALAATALIAGAGCVMPDQLAQVQKDLADVRQQLQRVEREQSETRRTLSELSARADEEAQAVTPQDLAQLDFRVDQAVRDAAAADRRLLDLSQRFERLERRLDRAGDRSRVQSPASPPGGVEADARTDRRPTAEAAPRTSVARPEELYNTAYADFSKGNYALAISGFEEFYAKFPDSAVADNALYWVGECHFSQGNFPDAIRAFDRLLELFPSSDKAAAGDLKKGLAYLEQNQVRRAIVQLQHVRANYAGTDEAKIATDKLTSLGAPI